MTTVYRSKATPRMQRESAQVEDGLTVVALNLAPSVGSAELVDLFAKVLLTHPNPPRATNVCGCSTDRCETGMWTRDVLDKSNMHSFRSAGRATPRMPCGN